MFTVAWRSARTGGRIASRSAMTDTVKVWDATRLARRPSRSRDTRRTGSTSVAFSPDGRRIVSWQARDKHGEGLGRSDHWPGDPHAHRDTRAGVLSVAFSPDGRRIASGQR